MPDAQTPPWEQAQADDTPPWLVDQRPPWLPTAAQLAQPVNQPSQYSSGLPASVPLSENPDWQFTAATRGGAPGILQDALAAANQKVIEPGAAWLMNKAVEGSNMTPLAPEDEPFKPGVSILPQEAFPMAKEQGFSAALTRALLGFTTPGSVLTLPLAAESKTAQQGFLAQAIISEPDAVGKLVTAQTPAEIRDAATELGVNTGMAYLMRHSLTEGEPVAPPPSAAPGAAPTTPEPQPSVVKLGPVDQNMAAPAAAAPETPPWEAPTAPPVKVAPVLTPDGKVDLVATQIAQMKADASQTPAPKTESQNASVEKGQNDVSVGQNDASQSQTDTQQKPAVTAPTIAQRAAAAPDKPVTMGDLAAMADEIKQAMTGNQIKPPEEAATPPEGAPVAPSENKPLPAAPEGATVAAAAPVTDTVGTAPPGTQAQTGAPLAAKPSPAITAEAGENPVRSAAPLSKGLTDADGDLFKLTSEFGKIPAFLPDGIVKAQFQRLSNKLKQGGVLSEKERTQYAKLKQIFPDNYEDNYGVGGQKFRAAYDAAKKAGITNEVFKRTNKAGAGALDDHLDFMRQLRGENFGPNDLWDMVTKYSNAFAERESGREATKEGKQVDTMQQQDEDFKRTNSRPGNGTVKVPVESLAQGDYFKLDGTRMRVDGIDHDDTGAVTSVTLEDGSRFGTQRIERDANGNISLRMDEGTIVKGDTQHAAGDYLREEPERPTPLDARTQQGVSSQREAEAAKAQSNLPPQAAARPGAGREQPGRQAGQAPTDLASALLADADAVLSGINKARKSSPWEGLTIGNNPTGGKPAANARGNLAYLDQYRQTLLNAAEAVRSDEPNGLQNIVDEHNREQARYDKQYPVSKNKLNGPLQVAWERRLQGSGDAIQQIAARLDEHQSRKADPQGQFKFATGDFSVNAENPAGSKNQSVQPQTSHEAETMQIYRAGNADEKGVKAWSSWSTDEDTARAYQDNPGFGGEVLREETVPKGKILDIQLRNRRGLADFAQAIGLDRSKGDEWMDNAWQYPWEESKSVKEAVQNSGYDFIRYTDDFPEGATTIVPLKSFENSRSGDAARHAAGDFNFDQPESLADQTAREGNEKSAAAARQAKAQMLEQAKAKLTSASLDTNAELFGGREGAATRQDKSGQGSLFAGGERRGLETQPVTDAITKFLGTDTLPAGISVVRDETAPWGARIEGRNKIVVNAAQIATPERAAKVILEEGFHGVWPDPAVQGAWQSIRDLVTPEDMRAEFLKRQAQGLPVDPATIREEAAIARLIKADANRGVFSRLYDVVRNVIKRTLGVDLPASARGKLKDAAMEFLRNRDNWQGAKGDLQTAFAGGEENSAAAKRAKIIADSEKAYDAAAAKNKAVVEHLPKEPDDEYSHESWNVYSPERGNDRNATIFKNEDGSYEVSDENGSSLGWRKDTKDFDRALSDAKDHVEGGESQEAYNVAADARSEILHTLDLPPDFSIEDIQDTKWGSVYYKLRKKIGEDADGEPEYETYKVSIRNHEPSPFRENEFGANDAWYEVPKNATPKDYSDAVAKVERFAQRHSGESGVQHATGEYLPSEDEKQPRPLADVKAEMDQADDALKAATVPKPGQAQADYKQGAAKAAARYRTLRDELAIHPDYVAEQILKQHQALSEANQILKPMGKTVSPDDFPNPAEVSAKLGEPAARRLEQLANQAVAAGAELSRTNRLAPKMVDRITSQMMDDGRLPKMAELSNQGAGRTLDKMTDWLRANKFDSPKGTLAERLALGRRFAETVSGMKDTVSKAMVRAQAAWRAGVETMKRPPLDDDYRAAKKSWIAYDQQTGLANYQYAKALTDKVPLAVRRKAMSVWLDADGDDGLLKFQRDAVPDEYQPIWDAAAKLTPDEKRIALQVKAEFAAKLDDALKTGLIKDGRQDYGVPQRWKTRPDVEKAPGPEGQGGRGNAGNPYATLDTRDPFFSLQRQTPSYFDGIMAKGVPENLDIAHLVTVYDEAFHKALGSRGWVGAQQEARAQDGAPVVRISGKAAQGRIGEGTATFVDAKSAAKDAVTADGRPYRAHDHPSLKDWKFVSKDSAGNPILSKGDMLIHPDYYNDVKNELETPKWTRKLMPGETRSMLEGGAYRALQLGSFLKASKFVGPFHVVTEALHASFHGVLPSVHDFQLDLQDPQQALLNRNMVLGFGRAREMFEDGLSSNHGIWAKVPGLGAALVRMNNFTFNEYIPRLKMKVGLAVLARNEARYAGKLNPEQIGELTGRQMDAAFGGQNWRLMGTSKNTIGVMRLAMVAPDFLISRAKVIGQAFKPYNQEQRIFLLAQAAGVYGLCRILNATFSDDHDPHFEAKNWDSVVIGKRAYHARFIVSDAANLARDLLGLGAFDQHGIPFISGRMGFAPKTAIEAVTGKDTFTGQDKDGLFSTDNPALKAFSIVAKDVAEWMTPMAVDGFIGGAKKGQTGLGQVAAATFGVQGTKQNATGNVWNLARKFNLNSSDPKAVNYQKNRDISGGRPSAYRGLDNLLDAGATKQAQAAYDALKASGHSAEQIAARYDRTVPFTGNQTREAQFFNSLTPQQKATYQQARAEQRQRLAAFNALRK